MRTYSLEDIRQCFANSTDFNEIFDVFQAALAQKITDVETYRILFWNPSLTPDEVRLFGEKFAGEFPSTAYDVYLWLAGMFEATYSSSDNHELAVHYYRKASSVSPSEAEPYLKVCDCFEPDLNIPPLSGLIDFVSGGVPHVADPSPLYLRLSELYNYAGDEERSSFYKRKAAGAPPPPSEGDALQA